MSDMISRMEVLNWLYSVWDGQITSLFPGINSLPSAEKTQLSGEDATSVCKCPCEYRDPCDVCHYDGRLGMGCPAEEGLKDE